MQIDVTPDDLKSVTTDERGRLNLGSNHGNKALHIAILDEGPVCYAEDCKNIAKYAGPAETSTPNPPERYACADHREAMDERVAP